ncbi:hypothetical protein [Spirochaeta dissipatitropha]
MELRSIALRDTLIHKLRELEAHTENVYLSLAQQFPLLIKEMEYSLDQSSRLIGSLSSDTSLGKSPVFSAAERLFSAIQTSDQQFQSMLHEDDSVFADMEQGIKYLYALEDHINRIRTDSELMELISLNALTVALKAGSAGRGFSFITEELQRISGRTIALTEDTTRKGELVSTLFHTFRQNVSSARTVEQELFQSFKPVLEQRVQAFLESADRIFSIFLGIREEAARIKSPLTVIMQEIQQQDIIKQSIDHVIMTLEEMESSTDLTDDQASLDELSFLMSLPDLAGTVIKEVQERLIQSLECFEAESARAHKIINEVDDAINRKLRELFPADQKHIFSDWLAETEKSLSGLFQQMRNAMQKKETLSHDSKNLVQGVFQIDHNFQSFQTIISRFHNLNMSSRIEVAKSSVLRDMDGTIEEMNELTDQVTGHVQEAIDTVQDFIQGTNSSITKYRRMIDDQQSQVESRFSKIASDFNSLHKTQNELSTQIHSFSVFSRNFQELFKTSKQDLKGLRGLLDDLDSIFKTLNDVKTEAADQRQKLLAKMGLTEWEIESSRLVQLIERFTIYTHKKAASDLAGFVVDDQTAESGEVTLF